MTDQDSSTPDGPEQTYTRRRLLKQGGLTAGILTLGAAGQHAARSRASPTPIVSVDIATTTSWPTFSADVANTGASPATGPATTATAKWTFNAGSAIESSPAVVNDTVYIGTTAPTPTLYALNAADGTEQWAFTAPTVVESPSVVDGTVYFGTWAGGDPYKGRVFALNATDGTEQWRFSIDDDVRVGTTVVDGTVYFGSDDQNVYAVNAADGTEQWSTSLGSAVQTTPAVVNGTLYAGTFQGSMKALDATDGTEQWSFDMSPGTDEETPVDTSPAIVDGTVYAGVSLPDADGRMYALDAANGSEQWSRDFSTAIDTSPAVVGGSVYIGTQSGEVYALDAADGADQWSFTTNVGEIDSSPVVVDGVVYVGGDGVYALDAADGTELWHYSQAGTVNGSFAVVDGTVYFGSDDETVYALEEGSGSTATPTPTATQTATPTTAPPEGGDDNANPDIETDLVQTVTAGETVKLDASASTDPDGEIVAYEWETGPFTNVVLSGGDGAVATFVAPDVVGMTTLTFDLTVTDDEGAESDQTVRVDVRPAQGQSGDSATADDTSDAPSSEGETSETDEAEATESPSCDTVLEESDDDITEREFECRYPALDWDLWKELFDLPP